MITENQESIQLLNTAIIKSKEKKIDSTYEERLAEVCRSPSVKAITSAINILADAQRISYDQAAIQIIETVRELDSIWNDYVMMEGISRLKDILKDKTH
jgi:LPS sulfotransferase NodH